MSELGGTPGRAEGAAQKTVLIYCSFPITRGAEAAGEVLWEPSTGEQNHPRVDLALFCFQRKISSLSPPGL